MGGRRKGRFWPLLLMVFLLGGCGSSSNENTLQGMNLIKELDYEGALSCFEAAVVNKEDMQLICRGQGIAYMGMSDYENAAAALEKALSYSDANVDQLDFDINYYLATAYYKKGDVEKAVEVYEAITRLRPQEKDAWYFKGTLELELGKQEQAKADFDRAVEIAKTDYDLRINIFCSCSKYGFDQMGATYLEAVLADETADLSDYDQGRISFYLKDYEAARLSLEKAKETNGADAVSLLGQTYEKLGDYNYAASVYYNFLETRQPNAELYNQLGLCRLKMEDPEGALEAFQAGIAMEGNVAMQSLKFNEIVAYENLGQFEQAAVLMEQYLAAYPDDAAARREYEFLRTRA